MCWGSGSEVVTAPSLASEYAVPEIAMGDPPGESVCVPTMKIDAEFAVKVEMPRVMTGGMGLSGSWGSLLEEKGPEEGSFGVGASCGEGSLLEGFFGAAGSYEGGLF